MHLTQMWQERVIQIEKERKVFDKVLTIFLLLYKRWQEAVHQSSQISPARVNQHQAVLYCCFYFCYYYF